MPEFRGVPAWVRRLRVGDVVLHGKRRKPRIVREVIIRTTRGNSHISFAITRCSWTGRCYTSYNLNDLFWAGLYPTPVPINIDLSLPIDKKIAECLKYENRNPEDQILRCCDVKGVG